MLDIVIPKNVIPSFDFWQICFCLFLEYQKMLFTKLFEISTTQEEIKLRLNVLESGGPGRQVTEKVKIIPREPFQTLQDFQEFDKTLDVARSSQLVSICTRQPVLWSWWKFSLGVNSGLYFTKQLK